MGVRQEEGKTEYCGLMGGDPEDKKTVPEIFQKLMDKIMTAASKSLEYQNYVRIGFVL